MLQWVHQSYDQQLYFQKSNLKRNLDCNFCRKIFQVPKITFKTDWPGVAIVLVPFEKPKTEVYFFDRATLSGFATR